MSGAKRSASESFGSGQLVKKQRSDVDTVRGQNGALIQSDSRKSALDAPVMELSGHTGEVFATRFDPTGKSIASGSMDRSISSCENYGVLSGHKGAVLDLQWAKDSRTVYSASADTTVCSWDAESGQRIRRHEGHEMVVNTLGVSRRGVEMLISGSDDGSISLWDPRQKRAADFFETNYPITAVALAEAGNELYHAGVDSDVKIFDLRRKGVVASMKGHTDTITSLQVSPDGYHLLSNSHDTTVRTWDIRPFAPPDRLVKTYDGAGSGVERNLFKASWSIDGQKIAAAGGDGTVVLWETRSGKLLAKLPGHRGAVNDVRFAPTGEPLVVSGSTDRNVMLGQIDD